MIIGVDCDGVVCNLNSVWLSRYNRDYNDTLTSDDILGWDMIPYVKPECGGKIYEYLSDKTLYDEAPRIEGALEGVKALRELGHRVVFCTSTNLYMSGRKLRWLSDNGFLTLQFGNISPDYTEMNDKGLLRADVLIDDHIKNLERFQGEKILFAQPHNQKVWMDKGCTTVRLLDWQSVVHVIKAMYNE